MTRGWSAKIQPACWLYRVQSLEWVIVYKVRYMQIKLVLSSTKWKLINLLDGASHTVTGQNSYHFSLFNREGPALNSTTKTLTKAHTAYIKDIKPSQKAQFGWPRGTRQGTLHSTPHRKASNSNIALSQTAEAMLLSNNNCQDD